MGTRIYYLGKGGDNMTGKKMGRPRTPEYTKFKFRYARIARDLNAAMEKMENKKDRMLVEKVLEGLRGES